MDLFQQLQMHWLNLSCVPQVSQTQVTKFTMTDQFHQHFKRWRSEPITAINERFQLLSQLRLLFNHDMHHFSQLGINKLIIT